MKINKRISKLRKAADNSNVALVALAIGVIIIIGMFLFTKNIGDSAVNAGDGIGTALGSYSNQTFNPPGK